MSQKHKGREGYSSHKGTFIALWLPAGTHPFFGNNIQFPWTSPPLPMLSPCVSEGVHTISDCLASQAVFSKLQQSLGYKGSLKLNYIALKMERMGHFSSANFLSETAQK